MAEELTIRYYLAGRYTCADCSQELGSTRGCENCKRARTFTAHMMALFDRWTTPQPVDDDGTDQFETHWSRE